MTDSSRVYTWLAATAVSTTTIGRENSHFRPCRPVLFLGSILSSKSVTVVGGCSLGNIPSKVFGKS